jgi:predicted  nucleic acid-binding Zn-ribbon protein
VWRPERYDIDMISSRSLSSKRRLRASFEFDEKYGDEKKLLNEITSLNDEKATLEEQVENLMEQVLGLRKELSTAQEAVVQVVTSQSNADRDTVTGTPSPAASFNIDPRCLTT